ncbi:UNC93-like protein MFSD11, partial [Orchesella cincta]
MDEKKRNDGNFRNVIILSIAFMLLMGAYFTMCGVAQTILQSVHEDDPSFDADGYVAMSIINGVFSISNFIAPVVVSNVGVRTAMIVGSFFNAFFIAGFFYPQAWVVYGTSATLGFAAASLWVANGTYFTRCSTKETIGKNMGIYWVVQSLGMVFGNGFIFWQFGGGGNHIESGTRFFVTVVLTCITACATITMCFLGRTGGEVKESPELGKLKNSNSKVESAQQHKQKQETNICDSFTEPFRLLTNKHMLLLIPPAMT